MLIDLSHEFYDGMPGFKYRNEDGTETAFVVSIRPFLTHAQTRPRYGGKAEFEITEFHFHGSMGTYLDAPYHRWKDKRAIGDIELSEVVLPGVRIDAREAKQEQAWDVVPKGLDIRGKAVLFNFGWDQFWGKRQYEAYPFASREVVDWLIDGGAKLVGVDTLNIDDTRDPKRPTHTRLLEKDILIVENLRNLGALRGKVFRFFAVPLRARGAAAMPVRAFAETSDATLNSLAE
ncbi:MAG: cyclase family protein [Anaerolineae bacterium]|nr:cyclase family protein [Anaerolineae bacterium]